MRSRVSASVTGTRTHASSSAAYRATRSILGVRVCSTVLGGAQRLGVVHGCGVVKTELAGFPGEPIQNSPAFGPTTLLELEYVVETDPAVPVGLLEGDRAVFEEPHEGRTANAKEVGCLLGGQE